MGPGLHSSNAPNLRTSRKNNSSRSQPSRFNSAFYGDKSYRPAASDGPPPEGQAEADELVRLIVSLRERAARWIYIRGTIKAAVAELSTDIDRFKADKAAIDIFIEDESSAQGKYKRRGGSEREKRDWSAQHQMRSGRRTYIKREILTKRREM